VLQRATSILRKSEPKATESMDLDEGPVADIIPLGSRSA
jgi:hypothetical protein